MALTRKFLEALSVPEAAVQAIIDEHTATTGKINEELKDATAKLDAAQKELGTLKGGDWEKKYTAANTELEALKADIAAKDTKAKKEAALTAYYEGKKIKGTNLKIALRGTSLDSIELDDAGRIKDTKALDELVSGDFKGLVEVSSRVIDTGAHVGDNNGQGHVSYNLKDAIKEAYKKD